MSQWFYHTRKADFKKIGAEYGVDQVTARIMVNRRVPEEEMGDFLNPDLTQLRDPHGMKDIDRAADLLLLLIRNKKSIRVFGDYDADGICSTYILVDGLKKCGADVSYMLPDRVHDGYGLNPEMVEKAASDGIDAVITCDNGIAAAPAVALAKEKGMTVIVTDHHEIPFSTPEEKDQDLPEEFDTASGVYDALVGDKVYHLPHADCVVDPHRADDGYGFAGICGAVVVFKLIQILFEKEGSGLDYMYYLPEAAFATVTDIMELRGENRVIVHFGLKAMADSGNTGLDALIKKSGLNKNDIRAWHVGFVLGPCFNASGRIDTAEKALQLLLEEDSHKAEKEAERLVNLNERRKFMTTLGVNKAYALLSDKSELPSVLVVYMDDLHESLCGLVAGKLKEKYHRPVFVLCKTENGDVKGSGRSIEAYSMYEKMVEANEAFAKENPDKGGVFTKFGGHPMAAGLSMREEDIEWLSDFLDSHSELTPRDLEEKVVIDVPMPLYYVKVPLIREFSKLEPFGNGNERPLFAEKSLLVMNYRRIGKDQQYRKLKLSSHGKTVDAIFFGDGAEMDEEITDAYGRKEFERALTGQRTRIRLDVVYYPDINDYMGLETVQARIQKFKVHRETADE